MSGSDEIHYQIIRGGTIQIVSPALVGLLLEGWRDACDADGRLSALHSADPTYEPTHVEALPEHLQLGRALNSGCPDQAFAILNRMLIQPETFLVVATQSSDLVGISVLTVKSTVPDKAPSGFLHFAVTSKDFRRRGVMRGMMEVAEEECRARSASVLWAECMTGNEAGVNAWTNLGMEMAFVSLFKTISVFLEPPSTAKEIAENW